MTLPTTTAAFSSGATEAEFKTFLSGQRDFIAQMLGTSGDAIDARTALKTAMHGSATVSAAYTVVEADCGLVLLCSGTFSLSLAPAATLGNGFFLEVVNSGSGTITIDPNSSEQIGGASTKTVLSGSSVIVFCDGAQFYLIGGGVTSADIGAALGYNAGEVPVRGSQGNEVGVVACTYRESGTNNPSIGSTYSTSGGRILVSSSQWNTGFTATGSWVCTSIYFTSGAGQYITFFRKVS